MQKLEGDYLAEAIHEITPFPGDAIELMKAAVRDAFPDGATPPCAGSLNDKEGMFLLGEGKPPLGKRIFFVRAAEDALEVSTLGSFRGGDFEIAYVAPSPPSFKHSTEKKISYVHPQQGTLTIDPTGNPERADPIIEHLAAWSASV